MKRTSIEILKDNLLKFKPEKGEGFTEEKFKQFVAEGLHVPFINAIEEYFSENSKDSKQVFECGKGYTKAEDKLRESLNKSKIVK